MSGYHKLKQLIEYIDYFLPNSYLRHQKEQTMIEAVVLLKGLNLDWLSKIRIDLELIY